MPPVDEVIDTSPLQDAKDILALKPTLTNKEKAIADKIRPQLKAIIRTEVRTELEAEYIKREQKFQEELGKASRDAVKEAIDNWKKEQEPLSNTDIATLLSQDYLEFKGAFKIRGGKIQEFHLVELPQAIEQKFLKLLRQKFVPLLKEAVAAEFKLDLNSSAVDKLQSLLEAAPGLLEVFAELVALCLDPWEENDEMNTAWVMKNLASHRILAVVIGQYEVNRYRDFFLNGFRLSKSLK